MRIMFDDVATRDRVYVESLMLEGKLAELLVIHEEEFLRQEAKWGIQVWIVMIMMHYLLLICTRMQMMWIRK